MAWCLLDVLRGTKQYYYYYWRVWTCLSIMLSSNTKYGMQEKLSKAESNCDPAANFTSHRLHHTISSYVLVLCVPETKVQHYIHSAAQTLLTTFEYGFSWSNCFLHERLFLAFKKSQYMNDDKQSLGKLWNHERRVPFTIEFGYNYESWAYAQCNLSGIFQGLTESERSPKKYNHISSCSSETMAASGGRHFYRQRACFWRTCALRFPTPSTSILIPTFHIARKIFRKSKWTWSIWSIIRLLNCRQSQQREQSTRDRR